MSLPSAYICKRNTWFTNPTLKTRFKLHHKIIFASSSYITEWQQAGFRVLIFPKRLLILTFSLTKKSIFASPIFDYLNIARYLSQCCWSQNSTYLINNFTDFGHLKHVTQTYIHIYLFSVFRIYTHKSTDNGSIQFTFLWEYTFYSTITLNVDLHYYLKILW